MTLDVTGPRDFDAFYVDARQRVLRCVYALTGDLGEAQDAAQEAFVRAWQRWAAVSTYVDPEAWVRLVACRIATSRWRSTRRGVSALRLLHAGQPRAEPPPAGTRIDVIAALRALPAAQRLVIVLHCLADMPLVEIAQQTDTPVGTIKARLSRGRKALAQRLGLDGITEQEDAHA